MPYHANPILRSCVLALALLLAVASQAAAQVNNDPKFRKGQVAAREGDYKTAMEAWLPIADAGHARAQYAIGALLAEGLGAPQDIEAAFGWWLRAAEGGHGPALMNVAAMYKNGLGVEHDEAAAIDWLLRAAQAGNHDAQIKLARNYAEGCGVRPNSATAYMWLEIARADGLSTTPGDLLLMEERLSSLQRRDGSARAQSWIAQNR